MAPDAGPLAPPHARAAAWRPGRTPAAARSLAPPHFRPTPHLPSRTHVLPHLQPPAGPVHVARGRPTRRRPDRCLRHARKRHQRARPLAARQGSGPLERVPARPRRHPSAPSASRALARTAAARASGDGPGAGPALPHAPHRGSAAPQRASLSALTGLGGPHRSDPGRPVGSGPLRCPLRARGRPRAWSSHIGHRSTPRQWVSPSRQQPPRRLAHDRHAASARPSRGLAHDRRAASPTTATRPRPRPPRGLAHDRARRAGGERRAPHARWPRAQPPASFADACYPAGRASYSAPGSPL
jgi:hypothetical protein